ncbi:MAG: GNAT family N-acetyltransferase [Bacteroidales bacterium]|nr:GNAT family N-acetyltransferase [Bacteroidales bacterium]
MKPKPSNIRLANMEDLTSIVDIYNQAVRSRMATGDMDEFKVEERLGWFQKFDTDNYPLYVVEKEDKVIGYASISPYRPGRKAMEKVAEISFFMDYSYHGFGIGSRLIEYVIANCKRLGKETLLAILMDINTPSISLLKKFGFVEWGHFPNIINFENTKCGHLVYGLKLK